MKKLLLASVLFSMAFAFTSNHAEASIQAFTKFGQKCPKGYRHATTEEAKNACNAPGMKKWYIVRLRGGASLSGSGYGCVIKPRDTRKLGGALCVPARKKPRRARRKVVVRAFTKLGQKCPKGWKFATKKMAKKACRAPGMKKWYIVRLRGAASLSGFGYNCAIKHRDTRKLGGALCYTTKPVTQTTQQTAGK